MLMPSRKQWYEAFVKYTVENRKWSDLIREAAETGGRELNDAVTQLVDRARETSTESPNT